MTTQSVDAVVFNVQRFSIEDGPGIRTTVFFKGCAMRCPWCHNPESIARRPETVWHGASCLGDAACTAACPESALSFAAGGIAIDRERCRGCGRCAAVCPSGALDTYGRQVSCAALFEKVMRDAAFYASSGGGVTLSGGEPLAQAEASTELLRLLRGAGIHTALDTCGAASEETLRAALAVTDLVLFDIKTVDPEKHEAYTGISFEHVARAAQTVERSGVRVWVRTPVIPGYTIEEDNVADIARFVAETFGRCERYELLAFSNLCAAKYAQLGRRFPLEGVPLLTREIMERLCGVARAAGAQNVRWSGPVRAEQRAS